MGLIWNVFELAGTISFALSGAIVGLVKDMDVFGIVVLAVLTAVGGGMIRDVLAGQTPPLTLISPANLFLSIAIALAASYYFSWFRIRGRRKRVLNFFYALADTVGLASFTVTGTMMGLAQGEPHSYVYPVLLGLVTAVGGGVLRDLMAQRVPVVLVADVYATASIAGSLLQCLVWHLGYTELAPWVDAVSIILLRLLAMNYKWQLMHPIERRKRIR